MANGSGFGVRLQRCGGWRRSLDLPLTGRKHVAWIIAPGIHVIEARCAGTRKESASMPQSTARDVMTEDVVAVEPSTPLKTVAGFLAEYGFRILPVITPVGEVLGVVSERDLILKQAGAEAVARRRLGWIRGETAERRQKLAKIGAATAGEAMTSPAVTVDVDARIDQVAAVMVDRAVDSLPVTDHDRLAGIVTRSDLVRLFTAADDELAESIQRDVVRRTLLLPPEDFDVQVRHGIVRVRGHVQRPELADLIAHTIARHPGVVRVEAEISWDPGDVALGSLR
jgi:CBS domain-containing protein